MRAKRFSCVPYILSAIQQETDECIVWPYHVNNKGYGTLGINKKLVYVHRFAYEKSTGPIPEGLEVMHKCDNPPCFNPKHLKVGTGKDNIIDASLKGRMDHPDGKGRNKHTFALRHDIIHKYAAISSPKLGLMIGVPAPTIRSIRNRVYAGPRLKRKFYSAEFVELVSVTKRHVSSYLLARELGVPASSIRNFRNRKRTTPDTSGTSAISGC